MKPQSPVVRAGFTIIELLVVVAILALLAVVVVPSVGSILRASGLGQAGEAILNAIGLARQTALGENRSVELRFYKYGSTGDPQVPGSANRMSSFQLVRIDNDGSAKMIGKIQRLPTGIILDSGGSLSSIFGSMRPAKTWTTNDPKISLPRVGTDYESWAVTFYPSGSTDLEPTGNWFLSLHPASDGDGLSAMPTNFVTIQFDPLNGSTKTYRP